MSAFQGNAFQNNAFQGGEEGAHSFVVDAVIHRPDQPGSFTLDADLQRGFDIDAIKLETFAVDGLFDRAFFDPAYFDTAYFAKAVVHKLQTGSFTVDAYIVSRVRLYQLPVEIVVDPTTPEVRFYHLPIEVVHRTHTVVAGSLTLDAVVLRGATGSFTLDAEINIAGSFTLDAVVAREISDDFTLDAELAEVGVSGFTLNAIILREQTAAFTLDAGLFATIPGNFTLDAVVGRTSSSSFTLNAVLLRGAAGSFTLNAVILTQIFSDTFTRTVALGLGEGPSGRWGWNEYDSSHSTSQESIASVDGSIARFGFIFTFNQYESWAGFPVANTGDAYFDFLTPVVGTDPPTYGLLLEPWDYLGVFVEWNSATSVDIYQFGGDTPTTVVIEAGEWYRLHTRWTDTTVYIRIWKRSDPEPVGWSYAQPRTFDPIGTEAVPSNDRFPPMLDIFEVPFAEAAQIDNVEIWSMESTWRGYNSFQLDARLFFQGGNFTLNAIVAARSFTLNAILLVHQGEILEGPDLIVSDQPTAYWRLGEPSGAFVDTMVGNNGSAVGTVTRGVAGIEPTDNAISLAGTGNVSIPDSADVDIQNQLSIEAWVKHSGTFGSFGDTIWGKGTGGVAFVWVTTAGRIVLSKSDTADIVQTTNPMINDMAWHHVVVVYVAGITANIYVDGVNQAGTPNHLALNVNASPAAIGSKYGTPTTDAWHGTLDEVSIYRYGLGADQVAEHYARRSAGLDFTLDAEIFEPQTAFTVDAFIKKTVHDLVVLSAYIARNAITLDAYIQPGGVITLNALVVVHQSASLTVDAYLTDGTTKVFTGRTINAVIKTSLAGSFNVYAELGLAVTTGGGSASVDALCLETFAAEMALDAEIDSGVRTSSFTIDADTRGQNEQRATFTLNASIRKLISDLVMVEAWIGGNGYFKVDAWLAGAFALDAELELPPAATGSYTLDARVRATGTAVFTLDAIAADAGGGFPGHVGTFSVDSYVLSHRDGAPPIWLDAVIVSASADGFSVDARIAADRTFSVDAFIRTQFTVNAYIRGNATIVYPDDGGPPLDPDGNPWPDWFKASRKYRINIYLDGVDVTGDVNFARTNFTQNAKTGPGTFELVLYGAHSYAGGEEIHVEIDDLRTFGGYVMVVERGYTFVAATSSITTILRGVDYNVLFDRLFAYNKASADGTQGRYTSWKAFAKGTYDDTIIRKVFRDYVDRPAGFDFTTYVDRVGIAAIEEPWVMPTGGNSLRQTMQSLSQVTTAVWWIDPYLHLHNHSRSAITAPYPITDGSGGVSSRGLAISADISQMVTQAIVWGTVARNEDYEITARVTNATTARERWGRWQYGEFRSDLHHTDYIARRGASIIERYRDPIMRAKAVIFEPGYQAGMGARIISSEHDLDEVLVIRSMALTFAVAKERDGDTYYGVPRYELTIGLDPESPWDIYDFLPFNRVDFPWHTPWVRCDDCCEDAGGCVGDLPPEGGEGCTEAECGVTDDLDGRVTSPHFGDTISNWGMSPIGIEWHGDTEASWADGTSGVLRTSTPPAEPAFEGGDDTVFGQRAFLNWGDEVSPMDITCEVVLSRPLAINDWDPGDPDNWGEYVYLWYGDGPPFDAPGGKFYVVFSGNLHAVRLSLYDDFLTSPADTAWLSTSFLDMTQPFTVRTTCAGTGEPIEVFIWQSDEDEPDEPQLTITGTTFSNHGWTIQSDSDNNAVPVELEVRLNWLDVAGLNKCDAFKWDTFNRDDTAEGALGSTSSDESPWTEVTDNGGTTAKIDDYRAVMTVPAQSVAAVTYNERTFMNATGPWQSPSGWVMRSRVLPIIAAGLTGFNQTRFILDDDVNQHTVALDPNGGQITHALNGNNVDLSFDPPAFSSTIFMMIRWTYYADTNSHGVSAWLEGTEEPDEDQMTFANAITDITAAQFGIGVFRSSVNFPVAVGTARWDWIDFDYEGKPCYCSGGIGSTTFDSFNRVPASNWGQSDTDYTWTIASTTGTGVTTRVDGTAGLFELPVTADIVGRVMTTDGPGPWTDGNFTMDTKFLMPDTSAGLTFYVWSVSANDWFYVSFRTNTHPNTLSVSTNSVVEYDSALVSLVAAGESQWLRLKWEHVEGTHSRAKIWLADDTEPVDWMVTRPATTSANIIAGSPAFRVSAFKITAGVQTTAIDYISFDFSDIECVSSTPGEGGGDTIDIEGEEFGVVNEGWGCETIKVHSNSFSTTGLVSKGTLTVYDADTGNFLEPYVEWFGHGNGKHFDVTGSHDRVTACYRNFVVNAQSQTTPRIVTPNAPKEQRYLPP